AADQELVELVRAVSVHAAAGMARGQVALVQRKPLGAAFGGQHAGVDRRVAPQAAALAAVGMEILYRDAHRHAGAAAHAVRAIDDVAGAAEPPLQRLRIETGQAIVVRIEHQVTRHPLGPVAAGVVAGVEQPQVVVLAHCRASILRRSRSWRERPGVRQLNRAGHRSTRAAARAFTGARRRLSRSARGSQMKHRTLFTALAVALMAAAGVSAAEPATSPQRSAKATLYANGDCAIYRDEAAKFPLQAECTARLTRHSLDSIA